MIIKQTYLAAKGSARIKQAANLVPLALIQKVCSSDFSDSTQVEVNRGGDKMHASLNLLMMTELVFEAAEEACATDEVLLERTRASKRH